MTQNTYLQTILGYFATLDIVSLRIHLKEEYSYQDTTKLIFLSKLDKVFNKFKGLGDTELLIYPGACAGKACDNCGVKGYRFVGNYSKDYIDLLFVIISDDIRDIFNCEFFNSDAELDYLQRKESIYIDQDDRLSFNKTPEYWEKVFAAFNAYSELIEDPPKLVNIEEMYNWLDKHSALNDRIGIYKIFGPNFKWTPFSRLYNDLTEFKSYILGYLHEIKQANYSLTKDNTEENFIEWVLENEPMFEESPFHFRFPSKKENGNYIFSGQDLILFNGEEFSQILTFIESYQHHYDELLNKYITYTDDEITLLFNNSNSETETENILSLKFHLERRKESEGNGKNIPLFINEKSNQTE
jgi:hypothetical protein